MFPKICDLYSDLTEWEEFFINPDKYPWEALTAMMDFMIACAGIMSGNKIIQPATREWPESLVTFNERDCKIKSPARFLDIARSVQVKGGHGLKGDDSVYIRGPIIFGRDVRLRQGAMIIGPAYIGDNTTIGQNCYVKNSILRDGVEIEFCTRVSSAFLGRQVFVGSNSVLSDRPFDEGFVTLNDQDGEELQTALPRLGLMAADHVRIGGGAVFVPGVILARNEKIRPGTHIMQSGVVNTSAI